MLRDISKFDGTKIQQNVGKGVSTVTAHSTSLNFTTGPDNIRRLDNPNHRIVNF